MQEYGTFVSFCIYAWNSLKCMRDNSWNIRLLTSLQSYGHISVLLNSISPPFRIDATALHTYTHKQAHTMANTLNLHISLSITLTKDARL